MTSMLIFQFGSADLRIFHLLSKLLFGDPQKFLPWFFILILFIIEILKLFLAFMKEAHFWRIFHPLSLEPKSSACFLNSSKSQTRSFNSPWVNRWGSQEDVLVSKVASSCSSFGTSVAASCSHSSSRVRCVGRCGIGKSSLWGTGLIADGKFVYFTVCLDLLLIPFSGLG